MDKLIKIKRQAAPATWSSAVCSVTPILEEGGTGILTSFLVPHNGGKGGAVQNFVLDPCVCDLTLS